MRRQTIPSFKAYQIPGDNPNDWETLLSYCVEEKFDLEDKNADPDDLFARFPNGTEPKRENKLLDFFKQHAKGKQRIQDNYESYLRVIQMMARYSYEWYYPFKDFEYEVNLYVWAYCTRDILNPSDKLSIIKSFILRRGIANEDFSKLNLPEVQCLEVKAYFRAELDKFLFEGAYRDLDEFSEAVRSISDPSLLKKIAYRLIGSRYHLSDPLELQEFRYSFSRMFSTDCKIEEIQNQFIVLVQFYLNHYEKNGFAQYAKTCINPLNMCFGNSLLHRKPWVDSNGDSDSECFVMHGGGFAAIVDFLSHRYPGYPICDYDKQFSPRGIQVHPFTIKEMAREEYEMEVLIGDRMQRSEGYSFKAEKYFDEPAILTAKIKGGYMDKVTNGFEAGLRTEFISELRELELTGRVSKKVYRGETVKELLEKIYSDADLFHLAPTSAEKGRLETHNPVAFFSSISGHNDQALTYPNSPGL